MYEELKKVYDWPDGELKSGPRLRGDQRLHYESDDKLDKKHSQLQPSDVGFFGMNENDSAERRFHSIDASCTSECDIRVPLLFVFVLIEFIRAIF